VTSDSLSRQEGKKKILVVDNEPDMTRMLKMALEPVGFMVDTFNDPVLALKGFKPNLYDLVILDIMMPRMNGFQLYEQLKKMDLGVKICFLTASSETYRDQLKEKHCELHKDLFLEMPLPIKEIIAEIKKRIINTSES
jgi:two-component system, OmpR family, response regulator ChvI